MVYKGELLKYYERVNIKALLINTFNYLLINEHRSINLSVREEIHIESSMRLKTSDFHFHM